MSECIGESVACREWGQVAEMDSVDVPHTVHVSAHRKPGRTGRSLTQPIRSCPPPTVMATNTHLLAEVDHMKRALHSAVVASAELFRFHTDAHKAGVARMTSQAPGKITASLNHSIEQYNQAYDSLEAHLVRSLAVLEANLAYEKERALERAQQETQMVTSPEPMQSILPTTQTLSPNVIAHASVSGLAARRPSSVALSSLSHRAPPLRLDLSAVLPMSPVTLAPRTGVPRSSVANEFPVTQDMFNPQVFGAPSSQVIDLSGTQPMQVQETVIDLTMSDVPEPPAGPVGTSDHPIELDLDSPIDLFGDGPSPPGGDVQMSTEGLLGTADPVPVADVDTNVNATSTEAEAADMFGMLQELTGGDGSDLNSLFGDMQEVDLENVDMNDMITDLLAAQDGQDASAAAPPAPTT